MEGTQLTSATALLLILDELDDVEDALLVEGYAGCVERPLIPNVRFDFDTYPDANAREDFRFTCAELVRLTDAMNVPNVFTTGAGDRLLGVEALAMLCYRISYPGKLSRIQKQFGRSDPAYSRIIIDAYCFLDNEWQDTLFFHDRLYAERRHLYVEAVSAETNSVVDKISMFIDRTKGFICSPGKRKRRLIALQSALDDIPVGDNENLQKVCHSGHKRRHCLNYRGVCIPDGLCMPFFGPIEGHLHDSTMLRESMLLCCDSCRDVQPPLNSLLFTLVSVFRALFSLEIKPLLQLILLHLNETFQRLGPLLLRLLQYGHPARRSCRAFGLTQLDGRCFSSLRFDSIFVRPGATRSKFDSVYSGLSYYFTRLFFCTFLRVFSFRRL